MEGLFWLAGLAVVFVGRRLLAGLQRLGLYDAMPGLDKAVTRSGGILIASASAVGLSFGMYENWRKLTRSIEALPGSTGWEAEHLVGDARTAAFYLLLPAMMVLGLVLFWGASSIVEVLKGEKDEELKQSPIVTSKDDFDYNRDVGFWKGTYK